MKDIPSSANYDILKYPPKIPLGAMSKAPKIDDFDDVKFLSMTLPGPFNYRPKKEFVMKNYG